MRALRFVDAKLKNGNIDIKITNFRLNHRADSFLLKRSQKSFSAALTKDIQAFVRCVVHKLQHIEDWPETLHSRIE